MYLLRQFRCRTCRATELLLQLLVVGCCCCWFAGATRAAAVEPFDAARDADRPWTRFAPLVFDVKMHLWEENEEWFIPATGFEAFVQTPWGSPAFNSGTQPSLTMLFRNTLFWGLVAEYNVGIAADSSQQGFVPIDVVQWAITKEVTEDVHVFVHGFQNESALPRLSAQTVVGGGFVWFPSDRLSVYGNWGAGTDRSGPATTFQVGLANAF